MAGDWLIACGVDGVTLQLNSVGDEVCRPAYREALRDYFRPYLSEMCEEDRRRFEINPLRMLDCKKPSCTPFHASAPRTDEHLCDPCHDHHERVKAGLAALGVAHLDNPRLGRGLAYYTPTALAFWHEDLVGAPNALGRGGGYDGPAEGPGAVPTPGGGVAME